MGCINAKDTFAPVDAAKAFAGGEVTCPEGFDEYALVPADGMFGSSAAIVQLPYDGLQAPTYIFKPSGSSYYMSKCSQTGEALERKVEIAQGWQSSTGHGSSTLAGVDDQFITTNHHQVTDSANKKMTIKALPAKTVVCSLEKRFQNGADPDTSFVLSDGWTCVKRGSAFELSKDGACVAVLVDSWHGPGFSPPRDGDMAGMMKLIKQPHGLRVKSDVHEDLKMAIVATISCTHQMTPIRNAQLSIYGGHSQSNEAR